MAQSDASGRTELIQCSNGAADNDNVSSGALDEKSCEMRGNAEDRYQNKMMWSVKY